MPTILLIKNAKMRRFAVNFFKREYVECFLIRRRRRLARVEPIIVITNNC